MKLSSLAQGGYSQSSVVLHPPSSCQQAVSRGVTETMSIDHTCTFHQEAGGGIRLHPLRVAHPRFVSSQPQPHPHRGLVGIHHGVVVHPTMVAQADGSIVCLVHTEEDVDWLYSGAGQKCQLTLYDVHVNMF